MKKQGHHFSNSDFLLDKNSYIISFILLVIPLLLFWQTTGFELLWDDNLHLIANPYLNPASFKNLIHFWETTYERLYIPVAYSLWGILKNAGSLDAITRDDGFIFHLVNLILHTFNGFFVYILLRKILKTAWLPVLGTIIFLAHPVQVETVGWVSEFRALISAFFGFLSLNFYLKFCHYKYATPGNRLKLIYSSISLLLFILSLLSKPSAVAFLFFSILIAYYLYRPPTIQMIKDLGLWLLSVIVIAVITSSVQDNIQTYPFWAKPLIWSDTIVFYLYKLFFPIYLSPSYSRTPAFVMGHWWFYIHWVIPVSASWFLWKVRAKNPIMVLSVLLFISGFLSVSGLKEFTFQAWSIVADRYLYLSMFGVSLCFAYIAGFAEQWWQKGVIILIIVFCLVWSGFIQIPIWKNGLTLWTHCIEIVPEEYRAYLNRGIAYQAKYDSEKALLDYNKSLSLNPNYSKTYNNRGSLYSSQKEYDKALLDLDKAIEMEPDFYMAFNNRGNVYRDLGKFDQALIDYSKAIEIRPIFADAFSNRGDVYKEKKQYDKALSDYKQAVELEPSYARSYNQIGAVYYLKKEYDKALSNYNRAIELNPYSAKLYNNTGIIYYLKKEYSKALDMYNKAVEIDPDLAKSYSNRGDVYTAINEYDKALFDYSKAITLDSKSFEAYNNRGNIHNSNGEYDKAFIDYSKAIEVNPNFAKAYNNRAIIYQAKGDYNKALVDYNRAISIDPDPAKPYYNRGIIHHMEKRYQKAIKDYDLSIEKDPSYSMAYNNRGVLYKNIGQYNLALSNYTEAINRNSKNTKAIINRGEIYYLLKDYTKSLSDLKKAQDLGEKIAPDFIKMVKDSLGN